MKNTNKAEVKKLRRQLKSRDPIVRRLAAERLKQVKVRL